MQALATPRQPSQHDHAPPLSLRSRAGRVTPLPDLDFVELGRQGLLSGSITSPRVSRRQATLLRSPDGALRVVSLGANPTAVVTRAGAVVRLAGGAGADVAAGDTCSCGVLYYLRVFRVGIACHVHVASMAPRVTPSSTRCPTQEGQALVLVNYVSTTLSAKARSSTPLL